MSLSCSQVSEESWKKFSQMFALKWETFENKEQLLKLLNYDESLAMVVSQVCADPKIWLSRKSAAFQGKTALWCLKNGRKSQVKAILMSMPR